MDDKELVEFASDFRESILNGRSSDLMCAAVCWPMETLLNLYGVECRSITTHEAVTRNGPSNHVWIKLADGRALDPTADQFGDEYPPVYLGPALAFHQG